MRPSKDLLQSSYYRKPSNHQRKPNIEENLRVLMIKLLTFNYWSNQMDKLIAAAKIFWLA